MRAPYLFPIILWLFFVSLGSYAQESKTLSFRPLSVDEGLAHTDATAIKQDMDGFIWVATYGGLNRYDGYSFKKFFNKNELLKTAYVNRLNDITFEDKETLWLSTQGGVRNFNTATGVFSKLNVTNPDSFLDSDMESVFPYQGKLFIINKLGEFKAYQRIKDGTFVELKTSFENRRGVKAFAELLDDKNTLVALVDNELYRSTDGKNFQRIPINWDGQVELSSFLQVDQFGAIWVGTPHGVVQLKLSDVQNKVHEISYIDLGLSGRTIQSVAVEDEQNIWIATSGGLYQVIGTGVKSIIRENSKEKLPYSDFFTEALIDRSGVLWLSSYAGGLLNADLHAKKFGLLKKDPTSSNTLIGKYVRAVLEVSTDELWIGTQNDGLSIYSFKTGQYRSLMGLSSPNVRSLLLDAKERVWIGTDAGIDIYTKKGEKVAFLSNLGPEGKRLHQNVIFSLAEDKFGNVWAGSWNGGISRITFESSTKYGVKQISLDKNNSRATFLYADKLNSEVFVGTTSGLFHITLVRNGEVDKVFQYKGNEDGTGLSSNYVWPVQRQDEEVLWVGTIGGGFCRVQLQNEGKYSCKCYTEENGLPSNDVEGLLLDEQGRVWLSGKGIAVFDPKTETFQTFDVNDGLQGNSFKIGSATLGKSGRMYFGGTNGLNYFIPKDIYKNPYPAEVMFTELFINNKSADPFHGQSSQERNVSHLEDIILSSEENNFGIAFSAMHYANPVACHYRYKLEGFDKEWVYTSSMNRLAVYNNLDYGSYTFLLEATNNDFEWSGIVKKLYITIKPPWYKSALAQFLWFMLAIGLGYFIYQYQKRWFGLKKELEWQKLEEKKAEELHSFRMQFFTNISHDFRTPLSLVLGPLEKLLGEQLDVKVRTNYYQIIQRNARRLLGLINELMDFQKVEMGSVRLKPQPSHIGTFVREIASEFYDLAQRKDISFSVRTDHDLNHVWFDRHIVEKILVNLISNAFKYTEPNGAIEIELFSNLNGYKPIFETLHRIENPTRAEDYFYLRIVDTGIGISEPSLQYIFDRYYRISDSDKDKHLGSGVGLALVKSLVFLHKGDITVSSKRGMGTEFLLAFPKNKEAYSKEILEASSLPQDSAKLESAKIETALAEATMEELEVEQEHVLGVRKPKIVVAEDNPEMQAFIVQLLKDSYEVLVCENGAEAFELAKKELPEIIISDVMMPIMDGNTFCSKAKNDLELSHIPFVLLTAKQSEDARIEGTESGADIYITKPFSPKLLQVNIQNLLENRERQRQWYSQNYFAEARELATNKKDAEFIQTLTTLIEENIENVDLDIELICRELGLSRTNLYNKIKGITGESIGEFIRDYKLKKAAKLLLEDNIPVVQVMYQVGIQSQSYFTKAFKKKFGKTPTSFVKSNTTNLT